MKPYLDQIFYEGLGRSLYYPFEKKIKTMKNQKLAGKFIFFLKIIYGIFSIVLAILLFRYKL